MGERAEQNTATGVSEETERRITIAIAIALVALLPSLVLSVLLWREADSRTNSNHALIVKLQQHTAEQERLRQDAREAIRQADIVNCREDELVKSRLREIVSFKPEEVAQTLIQLGIDPNSERGRQLLERSKINAERATRALRRRDCSKLPDPTAPFNEGS